MAGAIRTYFYLTKPGIIRGNAITAAAGFLLASKGHIDFTRFLGMLAGISLVIASACVLNNVTDSRIDALMKRTRRRAIVQGLVSKRSALIYAAILGFSGATVLGVFTNALALGLGIFGLFAYVVLYGVWKRRSVYGTVVGSLSGAVPIVVGYCSVTGRFDSGALILFTILVLWQMPHFYAIAIGSLDDYAAAGIPVLPARSGIRVTKIQMTAYIAVFIFAEAALSLFGYTGRTYLLVCIALGLAWLYLCLAGFRASTDKQWARGLFRFSLVVLGVFSVMIAINNLLP